MESVSFVGIDIKVIAWDERAGCAVAEEWLEVPPAVDAQNVEDYVFGRFGEPVDVAVSHTDGFGELVMGWVFPTSTLQQLALPSDGLDMMVVPFVRFPDGTRRELFEYTAELHTEFAALVGPMDPAVDLIGSAVPVESATRLEDEHLVLVGTEREALELQLGGWIRRLLGEGWTYLVLEVTGTGRYVQFLTHDGSWLRGEVVGDRYLDGHEPLSDEEHQRLVDVGWNTPASSDDGCGNYWVEWTPDPDRTDMALGAAAHPAGPSAPDCVSTRDIDEAARFAAAALCDVFRVSSPGAVDVDAGPAGATDAT